MTFTIRYQRVGDWINCPPTWLWMILWYDIVTYDYTTLMRDYLVPSGLQAISQVLKLCAIIGKGIRGDYPNP